MAWLHHPNMHYKSEQTARLAKAANAHLPHPQRAPRKLGRRQRHALPLSSLLAAPLSVPPLPLPFPPAVTSPLPLLPLAAAPAGAAAPPRRRAAAVCCGAGPRGRPAAAAGGRAAWHGRAQNARPACSDGCNCCLCHSSVSEHQHEAGPAGGDL